jgi:Uma2 family endonuclease
MTRISQLLTRGPGGAIRHPLQPGERLSQPEFHVRYEQYHEDVRFELIGGVVYMVPPAGFDHGSNDFRVTGLVAMYEAETPGVHGLHNVTIQLGDDSEPQPDCVLCVKPEFGGQTWINGKYLAGPPELVIEIADSSTTYDLNKKRKDYHSYGVLEYLVLSIRSREFRWFDLTKDEERQVDADGVLRSFAFPGLWLDAGSIFRQDIASSMQVLRAGLKTKAHAAFVSQLKRRQKSIAKLTEKEVETKTSSKRRRNGEKK